MAEDCHPAIDLVRFGQTRAADAAGLALAPIDPQLELVAAGLTGSCPATSLLALLLFPLIASVIRFRTTRVT